MTDAGLRGRDRYFVVRRPENVEKALAEARSSIFYMQDHYDTVDSDLLFRDTQNTARVIDAERAMSKLFVLPLEKKREDRYVLRFLIVSGHQITDGLTNSAWNIHFMRLLNTRMADLRAELPSLITTDSLKSRLPLPQEALYPPIPGNAARKRWFWVLSLILRHVRKPLPAAFPNPLPRTTPRKTATALTPTFSSVLDYSTTPPLNTFTKTAHISQAATRHLHRLCRQAGTSIGAGSFVLVAIVMMELHQQQHPNIALQDRRPFIGSFPINPRPFFNHTEEPNSLMLAFSDGVVLPFLSSELDLDGRIRLLVRSAHRQLGRYQKRAPPRATVATTTSIGRSSGSGAGAGAGAAAGNGSGEKDIEKNQMGSRGAGRVIAMNYIAAVERTEAKLPPHLRMGVDPQGELAVRPNPTMATCGVSSVGRRHPALGPGQYDLEAELGEGEDAFVADFRAMRQAVRARDGEFLVGIGGDDEGIGATVSFDGNAIDEELAELWKVKMEGLLGAEDLKARL